MSSNSASQVPTSFSQALDGGSGTADQSTGISLDSFVASLVSGLAVFGIEFGLFLLLHGRFSRI